ncbi:hypothetical protein VYU27_008585 [Nannochloropsis oceanica]
MRGAGGDVCFSDVDRKGGGLVEFTSEEDMLRSLERLDKSEFSNRFESSEALRLLPLSRHLDEVEGEGGREGGREGESGGGGGAEVLVEVGGEGGREGGMGCGGGEEEE